MMLLEVRLSIKVHTVEVGVFLDVSLAAVTANGQWRLA
jgi:hypothetical protein